VLLCSSWSFYNTAALVSISCLTLIYQHCLLDVVIAENIPWSTCCMRTCGVLAEVTSESESVTRCIGHETWWVEGQFIKIKVVDKQDVFIRFNNNCFACESQIPRYAQFYYWHWPFLLNHLLLSVINRQTAGCRHRPAYRNFRVPRPASS